MGILTVFLDKVTNLADEDFIGKSDPYVKLDVEQDNWVFDKDFGEKRSTKKQGEQNPEYGETFEWEIPSLEKMVLYVTVMDDDPIFDDKIGKCTIKLEELGLTEEFTGVDRVVDDNWFSKDARIFLQISYKEE